MAKIININDKDAIEAVVEALKNGGVAVLPTDTAYGICVDATNSSAIAKVFEVKQRERSKDLPIFISSAYDLEKYTVINEAAKKLADKFWPGALTLVLEAKNDFEIKTKSIDGTIGVRVPDSDFVRRVVKTLGSPITSTSANRSGSESCYSVEEVRVSLGEMFERVDVVVDGGELSRRPVSTIVKCVGGSVEIIREGAIGRGEVSGVLGFQNGCLC